MPRPRKPDALTGTERARASRLRRGVRTVHLPEPALADAEAVRARDGDASLLAAITRVLREAASRP